MLHYPFMINAFRAGIVVAVVAGAMGWFMVVRGQTFAGHALSVVGFPGAAGATLIGVPPSIGFFVFCTGAAGVIAALPQGGRHRGFSEESAVIGSVQALLLGIGFLFVTLYAGNLNGLGSLLFGNLFGITWGQVVTLTAVGGGALAVLLLAWRPLLFASTNPDIARARDIPVRALSVLYLVLLGAAVGAASQITGSLLVFALLVVPPAAAQLVSARPAVSASIAVVLAVAVTVAGIALAYATASYPPGVFITSLSFGVYVIARLLSLAQERRRPEGAA